MIKHPLTLPLICLLNSCALFNPGNESSFTLKSVHYLNPDQRGQAKPVVVTFYQLGSGSRFLESSYDQLMNNPHAVLGEKLIDRQDTEIQPGKTSSKTIRLKSNTSAIGIVASYEHIGNNRWKALISVSKSGKQESTNYQITLESESFLLKKSSEFAW